MASGRPIDSRRPVVNGGAAEAGTGQPERDHPATATWIALTAQRRRKGRRRGFHRSKSRSRRYVAGLRCWPLLGDYDLSRRPAEPTATAARPSPGGGSASFAESQSAGLRGTRFEGAPRRRRWRCPTCQCVGAACRNWIQTAESGMLGTHLEIRCVNPGVKARRLSARTQKVPGSGLSWLFGFVCGVHRTTMDGGTLQLACRRVLGCGELSVGEAVADAFDALIRLSASVGPKRGRVIESCRTRL